MLIFPYKNFLEFLHLLVIRLLKFNHYMLKHTFPQSILRKYDIRGIVGEDLTPQSAYALGFALTHYLLQNNLDPTIAILKDARHSGVDLKKMLIQGIVDAGGKAIDCGTGPSPLCYFASYHLKTTGFVTVTGSHNPLNYNGFKFGITGGAFSEEEIQQIATIAQNGVNKKEGGSVVEIDIHKYYIERLLKDFTQPKNLKFGFNALNGSGGAILPMLVEQASGMIFECEMNGSLATVLDPSNSQNIERMQSDLTKHNLDVIFAFDGDADRIMAITQNKVLYGEDILLLCAREVLAKESGKVIFDVKCSNTLPQEIAKNGGTPIMYKTGHSLIKKKMVEEGAILAGECSGHIYFKQGYYGFDDGIYTAIRLLSYFTNNDFHTEMKSFPETVKSPEIKVLCNNKFEVISNLQKLMKEKNLPFNNIDGVRADYSPTAWFLVRASNTEEVLIIRYEAQTQEEYEKVEVFVNGLLKYF
jgi:phosphomannomutase/phosphoglucomutase